MIADNEVLFALNQFSKSVDEIERLLQSMKERINEIKMREE